MRHQKRSFLPDFCHIRAVYAVVMSALVLSIVLTLASTDNWTMFWENFSTTALYILWIAVVSASTICVLRRWLGRLSHAAAGILAWLLMLLVAFLIEEFTWWALPIELMENVSRQSLLYRTLGITAILGVLTLRYLYENHMQRQRALAESRARFTALQARIRPHFLFNSLNTVISLIHSAPSKAEEMLYSLSDLFRASLADEQQRTSLGQEFELVRQYLFIEQQRLGQRLRVEWELQEHLPLKTPVPTLLLQPLVENAVYHGIETALQGGEIRIFGTHRNGKVIVGVSNTMSREAPEKEREGNHMAMENIRQRLDVYFGEEAGMSTSMVDDWYQVRLWFPVVEKNP